jgi:energy-coupling factor transport system permease protein
MLFAHALATGSLVEVGITLGTIGGLAGLARLLRRTGRMLLFSAGFAGFVFVINLLLAGYDYFQSAVIATRFIAIVGSTSLFFLTTSPDELEYVMKWFRLPRDVVFAFVTAVRFVPVLLMDALQIMDAQKSRGLELERGNFARRLRNLTPVLVPLVVTAVIRSGELAEAMEARAYGAVARPTSLYTLSLRRRDWLVLGVAGALFAVGWYWFYVSP